MEPERQRFQALQVHRSSLPSMASSRYYAKEILALTVQMNFKKPTSILNRPFTLRARVKGGDAMKPIVMPKGQKENNGAGFRANRRAYGHSGTTDANLVPFIQDENRLSEMKNTPFLNELPQSCISQK